LVFSIALLKCQQAYVPLRSNNSWPRVDWFQGLLLGENRGTTPI
jgi:hypothetical protein